MLAGNISINPGPITMINGDKMWIDILFVTIIFLFTALKIKLVLTVITQIVLTSRVFLKLCLHGIGCCAVKYAILRSK